MSALLRDWRVERSLLVSQQCELYVIDLWIMIFGSGVTSLLESELSCVCQRQRDVRPFARDACMK